MEQKRREIMKRIGELDKIKLWEPTAQELHSTRPMLARVHYKERKRYMEAIEAQKAKLTKELSDVSKYLQSVRKREDYRVRKAMPTILNGKEAPISIGPAPVVLPRPCVVIGKRPVLRRTRLSRYKKIGGR